MAKISRFTKAELHLRNFALKFPLASEHFPWGHRAMKVKDKIFAIFANEPNRFLLSVKLPVTGQIALSLPFAKPTAYGLGKSGWVSAEFTGNEEVPTEMFEDWLEESYSAVAPKKVLALRTEIGPTTFSMKSKTSSKKLVARKAETTVAKKSTRAKKAPPKKS